MHNCALCSIHACNKEEIDKAPKNCPSLDEKMEEINSLIVGCLVVNITIRRSKELRGF